MTMNVFAGPIRFFVPNSVTYTVVPLSALAAVVLFFYLLRKQCRCAGLLFCQQDESCG